MFSILMMAVMVILCVGMGSSTAHAADESCGDELCVIDALTTSMADETSSQINFTADVPEGFIFPIYVDVKNTDTAAIYRLTLYKENGFSQHCYVNEGNYSVAEIACTEDNTGTYSFEYPEDFTLEKGGAIDLHTGLVSNNSEMSESSFESSMGSPTTDVPYESDFTIRHEGNGSGMVAICGSQVKRYDLVIQVITPGIAGSASIKYSLDGGTNWSEEKAVPLRGSIDIYEKNADGNFSDTGLTAYFYAEKAVDGSAFIRGDTYMASIPDPKTDVIINHVGDSSVEMSLSCINDSDYLYDLMKDKNVSLAVNVLKGGKAADAVIEISIDGGKTYMDEMYVPASGVISFPELGINMSFDKADIYSLKEGDKYCAYCYQKSYMKAYILCSLMALLVIGCVIMVSSIMRSMLPSKADFEIIPYEKALD